MAPPPDFRISGTAWRAPSMQPVRLIAITRFQTSSSTSSSERSRPNQKHARGVDQVVEAPGGGEGAADRLARRSRRR